MASVGGDVVGAEHEVTLDGVGGERAAVDELVEVSCRDVQSAGGLAAGEPVLARPSVDPSHCHYISLYHRSEGCERAPGQA
jgi:acetaldehyde dehydrogenase (acetylating)